MLDDDKLFWGYFSDEKALAVGDSYLILFGLVCR